MRGVEKTMLAFIAGRTTRDKEDDRPSELPGSFVRARRGKKNGRFARDLLPLCGVRDAILSPPFYLKVSSLSRLARYTTADAMDAFA